MLDFGMYEKLNIGTYIRFEDSWWTFQITGESALAYTYKCLEIEQMAYPIVQLFILSV